MVNKKSNVIVGKPKVTGGVLFAPLGTKLPTDEAEALDPAFNAVGYITEDGVKRSESRDNDTIKAWGGDVIAVVQKGSGVELSMSFAEYLNEAAQALIYGPENVKETAATSNKGRKLAITGVLDAAPHGVVVVEMFSGRASGRLVFPDFQVTSTDDVEYKDDNIAARPVTATLLTDEAGAFFYEYWDDGVTTKAAA